MRSRYLKELDIVGREPVLAVEPQFDFWRAERVERLAVDFADGPSVRLQLAYDGTDHEYSVTLLLSGVRQLVVPEMTPLLFMSELEIEDVRASMLEGIRFEVISDDDGSFRCSCARIEILPLEPRA